MSDISQAAPASAQEPAASQEIAIRKEVRRILVDALSVDPDSILPDSRIMDDLNAESIDLLDIRFRVEKAFAIQITAEDLARAFAGTTSAAEFRARFTVDALCDYLLHRVTVPR